MRWRSFGKSGLKVTELCLGTMTLSGQADDKTSFAILDAAWAGGIRFLDTADCYPIPLELATTGRTEILLGKWVTERRNRDDLVIATKAYFQMGRLPLHRGNSRLHLTRACEASLRRLNTDRVDLYLCHGWDPTVPIEETIGAMEDLRRAGKIVYYGFSNVRAPEVTACLIAAERLGVAGIAGLQPRHNLLYRELEDLLFPLARSQRLGMMVYNPLAGGLLTGKHRPDAPPAAGTRFTLGSSGDTYRARYWKDQLLTEASNLDQVAKKHGVSLVTAAVAWTLANPDISSAIIGVSRPEQLAAQLEATKVRIPDELKQELDAAWYRLPRMPIEGDPRIADFHEEV
jgi:aryl-alcohol dehydrogenase-like predicted oxidoreductase